MRLALALVLIIAASSAGHLFANGEQQDFAVPEETIASGVKLSLYVDSAEATRTYILADVAVDEEFVRLAGDDWNRRLQQTVEGANRLVSDVGL